MDYKRALPGIIIGAVVLFVVMRLSKGGGSGPNEYNALVPSGNVNPPDSRDPARVQAYNTLASVGLGQLKLAEQSNELAGAIDLAKQRFANTLDLARISQDGANTRLQMELADRNYDRALYERSLDRTYALAQAGQIGNQIGQTIAALANILRRSQGQAGQRPAGGSSGSGSPGSTAPPRRTVPQATRAALDRLRQSALMQAIFGYDSPYANPTYTYPDPVFAAPGSFGYATYPNYDDPDLWNGGGGLIPFPSIGVGSYGTQLSNEDLAQYFGYGDVRSLLSDYGYENFEDFLADYY